MPASKAKAAPDPVALLTDWYERAKRDLPWRRTKDPYRIWVSEIMLQQTRVAAVIPYFERFLNRFPTIQSLAFASEPDLLAAWSGLGYYSRARNMQRAAQYIVEMRQFPKDYSAIRELPGVGDYTAAAIASIAFGLPYAVLDGNVVRVMARYTAERGEVDSQPIRKRLQKKADELLDRANPGRFNQAVMELGATVCLPRDPQCLVCPLAGTCQARLEGVQNELPAKKPKGPPIQMELRLLLIRNQKNLLLWRRPADSKKLAGFWELPQEGHLPGVQVHPEVRGSFRHSITNHLYRVELHEAEFARNLPAGFAWHSWTAVDEIPLSTTAKKALACWKKQGFDKT